MKSTNSPHFRLGYARALVLAAPRLLVEEVRCFISSVHKNDCEYSSTVCGACGLLLRSFSPEQAAAMRYADHCHLQLKFITFSIGYACSFALGEVHAWPIGSNAFLAERRQDCCSFGTADCQIALICFSHDANRYE
jgi:hypothetical protein